MRDRLAQILSWAPWIIVGGGVFAREYAEDGPRVMVSLLVWVGLVAGMLVLLAAFIPPFPDKERRDDEET
jgi:hypothetical protein